MSLSRTIAAALRLVAFLSIASAVQASPWALGRGEFYSELSGSYFSTRTYFQDSDQARVPLGERFDERAIVSHSEFGWKKRATVVIDVPFVSRTVATNVGAPGAITSTGLGDLGLAPRIGMHASRLSVGLELGWTTPLGSNRRLFPGTIGSGGLDATRLAERYTRPLSDTATFFSQGLQSFSAHLEVGGTAGKGAYWTLGGGVKTILFSVDGRVLSTLTDVILPYARAFGLSVDDIGGNSDRTADFATASASLGIWLRPQLLVAGEFRGEWSVDQGGSYDRIGTPVSADHAELEVTRILAGPRVTYRVDDRMDVFAGSWHTPRGRNVLHYDNFYAGIAWKNTSLDRLAGALGGTKSH